MVDTKRILVVDDEEEVRGLFSDYLSKKGYEIETAKDGIEALKKTETGKFDFIFLDIKMSGLDGVETFKRLKDKHCEARIVIMTGHPVMAEELITDSVKKQIHSILYKPFHMKDVLEIIKK